LDPSQLLLERKEEIFIRGIGEEEDVVRDALTVLITERFIPRGFHGPRVPGATISMHLH
jgi:hypothetical protein